MSKGSCYICIRVSSILVFFPFDVYSEGVDSMEVRSVSTEVPLDEIPFIMRALGFYPTEQEVSGVNVF